MQRNGNIRCYIICLHHNRKIIVNEISWISIRWTSKIPNRYIENESTFSIFRTAIQSQNTVSSNYIDLTFSKLNQISKAFENNKLWLKLAQCTFRIIQLEQQHIELCRLFNHHKISLCVYFESRPTIVANFSFTHAQTRAYFDHSRNLAQNVSDVDANRLNYFPPKIRSSSRSEPKIGWFNDICSDLLRRFHWFTFSCHFGSTETNNIYLTLIQFNHSPHSASSDTVLIHFSAVMFECWLQNSSKSVDSFHYTSIWFSD